MNKISLSLLILMLCLRVLYKFRKEALYEVLTQQTDGGANIRFLKF
jgi:hypothetical protein